MQETRARIGAAAAGEIRRIVRTEGRAVDRGRSARQALTDLADQIGSVVGAVVPARPAVDLVRVLAGADSAAAAETDALAVVVAGIAGAAATGTRASARAR